MRTRASFVCIAFLTIVAGSPWLDGVCEAQLEAVTLGVALSRLTDQVQQLIEQARNGARSVEIEAGIQLLNAIADLREAYQDSMNKTVDRVDATIKTTLDKVSSEVQ